MLDTLVVSRGTFVKGDKMPEKHVFMGCLNALEVEAKVTPSFVGEVSLIYFFSQVPQKDQMEKLNLLLRSSG